MRSITFIFLILLGSTLALVQGASFNRISNQIAEGKFMPLDINANLGAETQSFQCKNPLYDCSNHGFCSQDGLSCICDDKYDNYGCGSAQCCYKKEPRVKMFLLSFFVTWIGVPFFILGNIGLGVGMIILCCGGCCLANIGVAAGAKDGDSAGVCLAVIGVLATLACNAFCLATWIMFAAEIEPWNDKNGVPVASW
jgi:hypothetical protein